MHLRQRLNSAIMAFVISVVNRRSLFNLLTSSQKPQTDLDKTWQAAITQTPLWLNFYTPVFRRDVLWYGDVRPSVRPSVRPFSALFSYMLWHNELKFCTWLCFNVIQIKFECRHFASIFIRPSGRIMVCWCPVCPSVRPSVRPGLRPPVFRTFLLHALTYWAEILHMTLF